MEEQESVSGKPGEWCSLGWRQEKMDRQLIYLEWARRVLRQVYQHQDHLVAPVRAVGME